MVTDEQVEQALDWLRDNADTAAKARADRIYIEEYRKSLKAQLMKEHPELATNAQEREAYSEGRYLKHLLALRDAVYEDERQRFLREAAAAKISAWQTLGANARSMKI